jgi:two-component sensor histidine kinase
LSLLNRAGQVFISTLDLDQVLAVILEEIRHGLGVIACSAWLIDPAGELVCRQVTDPQSKLVRGWRLKPGQGLAGWSARTGKSLITADAREEQRHFKGVDEQTGLPLRSILTVPLKTKKQVIGVLQVVDTEVSRFNSTDLAMLESLAATATIAIENARLYEQARQDAETKATLLAEVNHRVKNNLAAIVGLLYAEQRHAGLENQSIYQVILNDLISRVQGLATVHSLLSASEWAPVRLSDLAYQVIRSSLQARPRDKHVTINVTPSSVKVSPDQAHHLALVINELATNSTQHALVGQDQLHITVKISLEDDLIRCEFRDNGSGYPEQMLQPDNSGYNVGFDLIRNVVNRNLRGNLALYNDSGAVTVVRFRINRASMEQNQ